MGGIVAIGLACLAALAFILARFSREGRRDPKGSGDDFSRGAAFVVVLVVGGMGFSIIGMEMFEWLALTSGMVTSETGTHIARGLGGATGFYLGWRSAVWVSPPDD